jgi:hypothetical protein
MDVCICTRTHSYVYTRAYAIIGMYTCTYTHARTPAHTHTYTQTSASYIVSKVSGEQSECGRRGTSVRALTHRHTQLTATLRCRWYSRKCLLRLKKSSSRRFQVSTPSTAQKAFPFFHPFSLSCLFKSPSHVHVSLLRTHSALIRSDQMASGNV